MSIQEISQLQKLSKVNSVDITPSESGIVSLDERLRDAYASESASNAADYLNIMAKANSPEYVSKPEGLFDLQVRLGEYKQRVETISALTRKGVDVVTTLLRA